MPDGGWEPAGCSLEDFNFVFLFPLSHNVCAFLRAPTWLQLGEGHICEDALCVTDWVTVSTASIKKQNAFDLRDSGSYLLVGSPGCAAPDHNQSAG